MINEMGDFVLELVQSEYETGHRLAEDRNEFNELCRDEGYRATKAMYDFYEECHNLGPAGFYAEYKDELDFDPMFVAEYGDEDDKESYLTGEALRVAIDEEIPYIRENIGENGTLADAVNDFMLACEESNQSADRSEVEAILADYFDSEIDDTISEALSNKEKLKRAYPELNFNTPVNETLNEAIDSEDKMKIAVGILFDMDNFTLSVRDNGYWLSMGVPDGEFSENDRDLAEANYEEHQWLIEDDDSNFDAEAFRDLFDAFETATDDADYDQNERARIIHEAEVILNMTESVEDMDRRCEECNALLNDMGKCPRCDEGEEDLDEAALLEWGKNDFNKLANKDDKAKKKANDKLINNFAKILFYSFKAGDKNRYYTENNQKIDYEDLKEIFRKYSDIINNPIASNLTAEKDIIPNLTKLIDLIVIDNKDNIIRRGLEVFKPGQFVFIPNRSSLFKIKPEFTAKKFFESIIGMESEETETNPSAQPEAETEKEATPENTNTETAKSSEDTPATGDTASLPNWITNESIKAAITLLAKRKNGSANYYDAEGNLVDYKNISTDNINKVFLDKEATKPFILAIEDIKKGLAKRKAAAIKSAALFGESYDDSMQYDAVEELELNEGFTKEDMSELLNISKQIGIETTGDLDQFSKREIKDGEDLITAMKRYKGEVDGDIEPLEEVFSEDVINEEFNTYTDIRAQFEADKINYGQREAFENMLVKACNSLNIDPELALIYVDRDREFDPVYFADESKELQYNVIKVKVFDLNIVRIEFKGTIYIIFKSQSDADIYMNYAH